MPKRKRKEYLTAAQSHYLDCIRRRVDPTLTMTPQQKRALPRTIAWALQKKYIEKDVANSAIYAYKITTSGMQAEVVAKSEDAAALGCQLPTEGPTEMETTTEMESDDEYPQFEKLISQRIAAATTKPLFTTNATPEALWAAYLSNIPELRRQHYKCHCCRRFIMQYGGLVEVDEDGNVHSVLWCGDGEVPGFFVQAVVAMLNLVQFAQVTGVFLWSESERRFGNAKTGTWTHLCGTAATATHTARLLTTSQTMALKREDFGILSHSLADYSIDVARQASRVLAQDALYRSEKASAVAAWFLKLHESLAGLGVRGDRRDNVIWKAVAAAPVGFCHVRSTVISTLLDDVKSGMAFEAISRRWKDKLHPLQYQRPTKTVTDGAIDRAEKIFATLGLEKSLQRRYATLADVLVKLWTPRETSPTIAKSSGIFDALRPKTTLPIAITLPETKITWEKFARTVLTDCGKIEVKLPPNFAHASFYGLLTAVDPTSPPLLQWDGVQDVRNPTSHYFYHGGSTKSQWGLSADWGKVTAIFTSPHSWTAPTKFSHMNLNIHFAIEGCVETREAALCLFPENLCSELHEVRAVIECYSQSGRAVGKELGTANGIAFSGNLPVTVRVTREDGDAIFTIDRMD
jgi:hypothetical protein